MQERGFGTFFEPVDIRTVKKCVASERFFLQELGDGREL
jgi:hypothetical protein